MDPIFTLLDSFGVNLPRFAGQLITFLVLLVVLRFTLYNPVLRTLRERRERIAQGVADADAAAEARRQADSQAAERLREAAHQAEAVLNRANEAAEAIRLQSLADTEAQLSRARQAHQAQLDASRAAMVSDVRTEIADLVIQTTEKVIRQTLTDNQRAAMTQQGVDEVVS